MLQSPLHLQGLQDVPPHGKKAVCCQEVGVGKLMPLRLVIWSFNFTMKLSNVFIQCFFSRLDTHVFSTSFIMICFFRSSKSGHFSMYTCLLFKKQCWFLVTDWWQSLMAEQDLHLYHWAPHPAPRDTADSVRNFWGFMGHRRDFT